MRCLRPFLLLLLTLPGGAAAPPMELWYRQPARTEEEAFPLGIGNGPVWRVSGDPGTERVQSGEVRVLIDWLDADQPATGYRRALDLEGGVASSSWKRGNSTLTTMVLASTVDDIVLIHLQADMPGALGFRVRFEGPLGEPTGERGELVRRQQPGGETSAKKGPVEARVWVLPFESEVAPEGKAMVVRGEGEAMIAVSTGAGSLAKLATKYDPSQEHPDATKVWTGALAAHLAGHRARMGGCSIDLGGHEAAAKPTDERLRAAGLPDSDPDLAALMFHFQRYRAGLGLPLQQGGSLHDLLVTSADGVVTLLPHLPAAWKDGSVKGFPATPLPSGGEFTVDMTWKGGKPVDYVIHRVAGLPPSKVKARIGQEESEVLTR